MADHRSALFVRLPAPLLSQLDARIQVDGRTKQAVVEDLLSSQLTGARAHGADDILDLAETADLLRLDEADVLARIVDGDFPARRFGTQWRCSRAAVLAWLSGTDPAAAHPTGFTT